MRRPIVFLLVVSAVCLTLIASIPTTTAQRPNERKVTFIITLPEFLGNTERSSILLVNSHNEFRNKVNDFCPDARIENEFSTLMSGFSVTCNISDAKKISAMQGVKKVDFARYFYPHMFDSVVSTRAVEVWDMKDNFGKNINGDGILVGIIDSGISYDHPSFTGGLNPDSKVCVGYDLSNLDDNPYPEEGHIGWHGTHCAGIVAATGLPGTSNGEPTIKGMAPKAKLGAYKVFGKVGGARTDRIIQAMERALLDGCNIISMSLGSEYVWADEPICKAVDKLVERGVVVCASAGNSGYYPKEMLPYQLGSPGGAKYSICVGALDDSAYPKIKAGEVDETANYFDNGVHIKDSVKGKLVYCNYARLEDIKDVDLTGAIALIKRGIDKGEMTFYEKVKNAEAKGAIGCIIFNNIPGPLGGYLVSSDTKIPSLAVSDQIGDKLKTVADSGGDCEMTEVSKLGYLADFTSAGPTNDFRLKPDVSAPGVNVLSAVGQNSYVRMSGTSMACPAVAGASALVIQAHPDWNAHDVRSAIINYANPQSDSNGKLHPVLSQGTGRVDCIASINAPALFFPTALDFGFIKDKVSGSLRVKNASDKILTFKISLSPESDDSMATFADIMLKPGEKKDYPVVINSKADIKDGPHSGYILFTSGNTVARVAYLYFTGEKPDPPTVSHLRLTTPVFSPNDDGKLDSLRARISLNKMLIGYEIDLTDDKDKLISIWDFGIGLMGGGMWDFNWDGTIEGEVLEPGRYRMHFYTLQIGKDPTNKNDWEHNGPVEFYIAQDPPQIKFNLIEQTIYNQNNPLTISGSIDDLLSNPDMLGKKGIKKLAVQVNEKEMAIELEDDGTFTVDLNLKPGDNILKFIARNAGDIEGIQVLTIKLLKRIMVVGTSNSITVDGKVVPVKKISLADEELMIDLDSLTKIIPDIKTNISGQVITVNLDNYVISLKVGQPFLIVNGEVSFCEPPKPFEKSALIPIGAILEAIGAKTNGMSWDVIWRGD